MKHKIHAFIVVFVFAINLQAQKKETAENLLLNLEASGYDTNRVNIFIKLAKYYYFFDSEKTWQYATSAIDLSKKLNYSKGIADAYVYFGALNNREGAFKQALQYYSEAFNIYNKMNDVKGIVYVYNNQALTYTDMGEYGSAVENYMKALEVLENFKDDTLALLIEINLGELYYEMRLFKEAENYLQNAEQKALTFMKKPFLSHIYCYLGCVNLDNNHLETAGYYFTLSMQLSSEINNNIMASVGCRNLGLVYQKKGNMKEAVRNYEQSLQMAKELNSSVEMAKSFCSLSDAMYQLKDYDKALVYGKKGLELSRQIGFKEGIKGNSRILSETYYALNNIKQAYDYRLLADSVISDFSEHKTVHAITEFISRLKYKQEQYTREISEQRNKVKNTVAFISVFSILAVLGLICIAQRNKIRKVCFNEEHLHKELAFKTITLARKNEIFTTIENLLKDNKSDAVRVNQKKARKIINAVKLGQTEDIWKEFEIYFLGVHKNFYKKLLERYPDLTVNEKRLCALLRMNMTTKEISEITHQTNHSVDIARGRLRKKLGITYKKESIDSFLSRF